MKEETTEFVRKLRKVIKALMWLCLIGSFVFFWIQEKMVSQLRIPLTGETIGMMLERRARGLPPLTPSAEAVKAAKRMDWTEILIGWALFGIAPTLVLGLILYLMPGGKKKPATPGDSSGG